jgi:hypothetical protein
VFPRGSADEAAGSRSAVPRIDRAPEGCGARDSRRGVDLEGAADVFDKLFLLIGEILFLARVTAWRRAGLGRKSVTLPRMGVSHLPRPCALAACEDAPQFARGFSDAVRLGASSVVCQAS